MLRLEGRTDGRTGGRRDGEETGGGRKRGLRATRKYLFPRVRLSAAGRHLSRAGTRRDGPWESRGDGSGRLRARPHPPHPAIDNPLGTSPISTPLSFLSAWRAGASPINFIFLLICSPFRNGGSVDLSLPPSKKYSVSHPVEGRCRRLGMLPLDRASPRGGCGHPCHRNCWGTLSLIIRL